MRYDTLGCLTALVLVFSAQGALAGEARVISRMDVYEAQARRYVADRTRTVAPRTRYVESRPTYVDHRPVRQQVAERSTNGVDVVRNASFHAPTESVVVADVEDVDLDRVSDGQYDDDSRVVVSRAYAAPSSYAGYRSYNSYSDYGDYGTTYVRSSYPVHRTSSYGSVYYRSGYRHPAYRPTYYRSHCGPYYGGYYRGHYGGHRGHYGGHHRGHFGHYGHVGHYRGHRGHGSHWGFSVHFRF